MTRRTESNVRPKPPRSLPRSADLRTHVISLLMLAAIFGAILLGVTLLVFVLRDLWVFMVAMMQPQ